ncbi:signal peptidase I [Desertivibrio insolitus]|uniref:signal peptidase I n=1 Tax=Herbiconiux sp. SYSU D00978 TaxID=2812562 RepID=UPI001F617F6E|nr:signal peptidase I [Herbiconiux sp. SYSU D00978]
MTRTEARPAGRTRAARTAPVGTTAVVLAGAVGVLALRLWVFEPVTVMSDSMSPTIEVGDVVMLTHIVPEDSLVGDVVAFRDPDDEGVTIKRVAAEGGQTLIIRDGVLFVDEQPVDEPYVDPAHVDGTFFHQVTVPEGHVFVLGDNRAASIDSRDFGFVALEELTGTVPWVG